MATALKVLFHEEDCGNFHRHLEEANLENNTAPLVLERNEVIALINTLKRLSESIEVYRVMSIDLEKSKLLNSNTL